ncbi:MAG: hypothetical protein NWF04_06400 [Candidatus Bathyarchaeota archaeon]|nr:hypothetical protein [Candidatus Bathyarchaeota archaeon]
MFLSCSFFKPLTSDVFNILLKKGTYSLHNDFKLYIKNTVEQTGFALPPNFEPQTSSLGKLIEVYYDDTITVRTMDEINLEMRSHIVKYTEGPKWAYIFHKEPLTNIIGIFASSSDAGRIAKNIGVATKKASTGLVSAPLKSVSFLLKEKENEINKIEEFSDTIEVRASDVKDPYIADVWLKGSAVDESIEYEKLIRDPAIGGIVEYMAINYKKKTYYIFSDGRLFTRQASEELLEDVYPIYEIVERLYSVGVVQI